LFACNNELQASAQFYLTTTAGSHTFALRYRVSGGGAASFANRTVIIQPVP
jgi:hypothetical protein